MTASATSGAAVGLLGDLDDLALVFLLERGGVGLRAAKVVAETLVVHAAVEVGQVPVRQFAEGGRVELRGSAAVAADLAAGAGDVWHSLGLRSERLN